MPTTRRRLRAAQLVAIAALGIVLAACTTTAPTDTGADSGGDAGGSSGSSSGDSSGSSSGDGGSGSGDLVVLSGTGTYAIPDEMPYGGYQLLGEPAAQPDGCTWSIQDADGGIGFENTGPYAFITDIPEAVTFVTDGCPDWEQFE